MCTGCVRERIQAFCVPTTLQAFRNFDSHIPDDSASNLLEQLTKLRHALGHRLQDESDERWHFTMADTTFLFLGQLAG